MTPEQLSGHFPTRRSRREALAVERETQRTREELAGRARPAPQPLTRRDVRLAETARVLRRRSVRRIRTARLVSRTGAAGLAAVLVPSVIVGGVALAVGNEGNQVKEVTLRPGGSVVADSGSSFADGQGQIAFELPGRPAGQSLYLGVELRRTAAALYRAKVRVFPDGALSVDVGKVTGGSEQFLGSKRIAAVVPASGGVVTVSGSVSGATSTTVGVKAWVGGAAPAAANLVVSDGTSPVSGAGALRGWAYLSRNATAPIKLGYRDLRAGSGGAVTPVAPAPKPSTTPAPAAPEPSAEAPAPAPAPAPAAPAGQGSGASAGMAGVLAKAGALAGTDYPVPAGAVHASPSGSDGNAGTASSPVRTVAAAVAKAPAGGTVVLRGGTYREGVGSVNKRLSIQAYPGEKPVISGADVETGWAASGGAWRANWRSPLGQNQFRGEEVKSGTAAGRVEQVFRDGSSLKQVLNRSELRSGTFWLDPATLQPWVADNPAGSTMEISTRTRGMTLEAGAAGSKILGLRFTAFAAPHLDNSGGLYVSSPNSLIENSTFDHSSGAGLKIAATNLTVNRITARDNAAEGMQGNRNDGSVVKNSLFKGNNTDDFKVWLCGASCTVAGFKTAHTDNLVVTDNAFVDNNSNGFWCDLGCTNTRITGNAITGSYDGIFYEVSSTGTITGNYVEKSDKGIRLAGTDHTTISNNTLVNNNWQLTMYDDRRSPQSDAYSAQKGLTWNTTDVVIRNNTIVGGAQTTKLLEANATAQVTSRQMYKQLLGNQVSGSQVMLWCPSDNKCQSHGSISAWRTASGLDF